MAGFGRPPYFHEIGAATGRRYSAFPPVLTRYKLLEIERPVLTSNVQPIHREPLRLLYSCSFLVTKDFAVAILVWRV